MESTNSDRPHDKSVALQVSEPRPIAVIVKDGQQQALSAAIVDMIVDVVQYVNVQRNMNATQVAMAAQFIQEKFYYLRIAEIKACFDRGCMGLYGQLYERMDGTVLMDWLTKYDQDRMKEIRKAKDAESENLYALWDNPVMNNILHEVTDKLKVKEERPVFVPKPLSQFEEMVMDEWGKLERFLTNTTIRHYKDKSYDFTEYRMTRYNEMLEQENQTEQ